MLDLVANASAGLLRKTARISKYKIDCVVPSNLKQKCGGERKSGVKRHKIDFIICHVCM